MIDEHMWEGTPEGDIIEMLGKISDQLEKHDETLRQLIAETKRTNTAMQNCRKIESKKKVTMSLEAIDIRSVQTGNCLFIGYISEKLIDFLKNKTKMKGINVVVCNSLGNQSELYTLLSDCGDGDVVLMDLAYAYYLQDGIPLMIEVIEHSTMTVKIGKGSMTRNITLKLPQIHVQFYDSTDLFLPMELEQRLTSIYVNADYV